MELESNGTSVFVRIEQDQEVVSGVCEAVDRLSLPAAVVTSGMGLVRTAELGFFPGGGSATRRSFPGLLDLSGLSGCVLRRGGTPVARLQAVLTDGRHRAVGGRLITAHGHGTVGVLLSAVDLMMDVCDPPPRPGPR